LQGGTVGVVVASKHPTTSRRQRRRFGGWQEYSIVDAGMPGSHPQGRHQPVPLSAYLGAVGMPGVTAWYGLMKICEPNAGQTIVVSAAAARWAAPSVSSRRRAAAVRSASPSRHRQVRVRDAELGFDACIDYKAHKDPKSLYQALKEATPDGVDGNFENVGGPILDAVLCANEHVRSDRLVRNDQRLRRPADPAAAAAADPGVPPEDRGFIVGEHPEVRSEAMKDSACSWHRSSSTARPSPRGSSRRRRRYLGLLKGRNLRSSSSKLV
jgi:hypothetical protein